MRGTVIVAMIDAICIGIGIFFLGVPMAVPLAVVIFVSSFVPLVGAVASGAVAVVVSLVTQGPFTALLVLLVVLAVQQIEGHVLQPFILGRAVRVHPLAVVLSVAAGSMIAGIGGAISAVPLVAVSNTVVGVLRARAKSGSEGETGTGTGTSPAAPAPDAEPAQEAADPSSAPGPDADPAAETAAEGRATADTDTDTGTDTGTDEDELDARELADDGVK